jgi:hypothetical protein
VAAWGLTGHNRRCSASTPLAGKASTRWPLTTQFQQQTSPLIKRHRKLSHPRPSPVASTDHAALSGAAQYLRLWCGHLRHFGCDAHQSPIKFTNKKAPRRALFAINTLRAHNRFT